MKTMNRFYQRMQGRFRLLAIAFAALTLAACGNGEPPETISASGGYEVWALDQGTHIAYIYDSGLQEVDRIDLGSYGAEVPHMIEFSSDHRYAVVANVASGNIAVIRTSDRAVIDVIETGPRTHMASFSHDDTRILVDVIGDADTRRDGKLVEIRADLDNETFEIERQLVIADDPMFQENEDQFEDAAAICHYMNADHSQAYVTLGPDLDNGGLLVVNTDDLTIEKLWGPDELRVNCGTMLTPDGRHMLVNGGGDEVGIWYAIDTETLEVVHEASSEGIDAHGVRNLPNGEEIWMVNRGTSDGIVIDAETLDVIDTIPDTGMTPDILDFSPDSRFAFISLRGPNPVSMPHMAKGETPGFSVIDVESRSLIGVVMPDDDNEASDFHGIGVRVLEN